MAPLRSLPLALTLLQGAGAAASVRPLKDSILRLARGTQNGLAADDSTRAQIDALAKQLEEQNPTPDLARSPLINGPWRLVFTTTTGGSAGKLGPFVGDVEQHFDLEEGGYTNFVKLGPVEGALEADWNVVDDSTWQVNFQSIRFSLFNVPLVQRKLNARGTWFLKYLDEDWRILYAQGGSKPANIYILERLAEAATDAPRS